MTITRRSANPTSARQTKSRRSSTIPALGLTSSSIRMTFGLWKGRYWRERISFVQRSEPVHCEKTIVQVEGDGVLMTLEKPSKQSARKQGPQEIEPQPDEDDQRVR